MSYGKYLDVKLTFDVLARVNTKCRRNIVVSYKAEITCIKHEMYDYYEYGSLDVSEYDYDEENLKKPKDKEDFYIIHSNGNKYEPMNDEIVEVLEVFTFDFDHEEII